jgi:hypothetical protein
MVALDDGPASRPPWPSSRSVGYCCSMSATFKTIVSVAHSEMNKHLPFASLDLSDSGVFS